MGQLRDFSLQMIGGDIDDRVVLLMGKARELGLKCRTVVGTRGLRMQARPTDQDDWIDYGKAGTH